MTAQTILVVDDDQAVRLVATEMLSTLGYQVDCAATGREALERLDEGAFDVVLLDVGMPIMSGVDVYRTLRGAKPEQKVVFITGYAEEDLTEYLDDITQIVTKPFSISSLDEGLGRLQA